MAKKSATKKVRNMIVGSEGHEDYLVIARQNGYVLGLKPLLMISSDEAQFGFRLRMQKAQTTEKPARFTTMNAPVRHQGTGRSSGALPR